MLASNAKHTARRRARHFRRRILHYGLAFVASMMTAYMTVAACLRHGIIRDHDMPSSRCMHFIRLRPQHSGSRPILGMPYAITLASASVDWH